MNLDYQSESFDINYIGLYNGCDNLFTEQETSSVKISANDGSKIWQASLNDHGYES